MTTLLEFSNVFKSFEGSMAVRNLSFTVDHGEFVAVMGPSGCGKTTTLRLLAGFDVPDTGEVRFAGKCINTLKPWQRNLPMVWQNLALFPFLSVVENVEFGLKMRKMPVAERRKKAMIWLDRLQIAEFANENVERLSGGQRQRVALARTLVTEPKILLLDEPLSALDANMVAHMQTVLPELQKQLGITFLYVTHSRAEAFAMADRIVVMNRGEVFQSGSPADLFYRPDNRFVAEFIGDTNIFSGKLVAVEQSAIQMETADGILQINQPPPHVKTGAKTAEIAVNEEDITVSRTPQPGFENTIKCSLESESYCGGFVRLRLRTPSGNTLTAKVPAGSDWRAGLFSTSDLPGDLFVQWRFDAAHFLQPEPESESESVAEASI